MRCVTGSEFEVYKDYAGVYRWRLRAGDAHVIAVSGEGFVSEARAKASISQVKQTAPEASVRDTT